VVVALLVDCAGRAERVRRLGVDVVFVVGAEFTILNREFLPGEGVSRRVDLLPGQFAGQGELLFAAAAYLRDLFVEAVAVVRELFRGPVTYASAPYERVEWALVDIMSSRLTVDFEAGTSNILPSPRSSTDKARTRPRRTSADRDAAEMGELGGDRAVRGERDRVGQAAGEYQPTLL
jgi:hypothetical protein